MTGKRLDFVGDPAHQGKTRLRYYISGCGWTTKSGMFEWWLRRPWWAALRFCFAGERRRSAVMAG